MLPVLLSATLGRFAGVVGFAEGFTGFQVLARSLIATKIIIQQRLVKLRIESLHSRSPLLRSLWRQQIISSKLSFLRYRYRYPPLLAHPIAVHQHPQLLLLPRYLNLYLSNSDLHHRFVLFVLREVFLKLPYFVLHLGHFTILVGSYLLVASHHPSDLYISPAKNLVTLLYNLPLVSKLNKRSLNAILLLAEVHLQVHDALILLFDLLLQVGDRLALHCYRLQLAL